MEGIADYIPSLDQGLAVLTNSTLAADSDLTVAALLAVYRYFVAPACS